MKRVIALAALAAIGFAGAAYAGEATAPKPMTDAQLDKVTAGATVQVFTGSDLSNVQVLGQQASGPGGAVFVSTSQTNPKLSIGVTAGKNLIGTGAGAVQGITTTAINTSHCGGAFRNVC